MPHERSACPRVANTASDSVPDAAASARQPVLDRRVWRRHPVHLVHPSRLRQQSIRLVSPPELACSNATMRVYLGTQMASYDKGCGKQQTLHPTIKIVWIGWTT